MTQRRDDPKIDELLADSLVRAVMRADRVEPEALRSLMRDASARLSARRQEVGAARRIILANPAFGRPADSATPLAAANEGRTYRGPCESALCW